MSSRKLEIPRNISCKDQHNKGKKWQGPSRSRKNEKEIVRTHRRNGLDSDDVITHLEPDILECEVKWALGSITMNKASGGDGIPVELFQTLEMMLSRYCTQYAINLWKLSGHWTGESQFSFQSQRRAIPKNIQTTEQLLSFHILARWYTKSLKLGFSNMWIKNVQIYKLNLEKAE